LIWQGAVAIDLLYKLLHRFRPYERTPGQTDTIYQEAVQRITKAIEDGGGKRTIEEMKWIAKQFEGISVDRSQPRPRIGLVGEIYLRFNHHVNLELVRQVEQAGGEVQIASIAEWLYYTNWAHKRNSRAEGDTFRFIKTHITDKVQQFIDHQLIKTIDHLIDNAHDTSISELMDNLKPYYHPALHSEAILTMGASIDFAKRGFSGILNVMPFSCMPGTITAGMAPRIREDWDNIPWLDISYDAQEGTNIKTRLEAFMYQAMQYMRRKQREDKEKELVA
jgi:predicted nucleotide-binding protein (sugar kinase/HSP70/actin superfamily)